MRIQKKIYFYFRFHVVEWMSLCLYHAPQNEYLEGEHDTPMLESCLTFLATLVNVRTNLGEFLMRF